MAEEEKVILGIVNHEYRQVSYRVVVKIDGKKNNEVGPIALEHEEKGEREVGFVPEVAGEQQKVEFFLYRNGDTEPYLEPLRLIVNVAE